MRREAGAAPRARGGTPEVWKNVLIAFLVVLCAFLMRETGLFSDVYESVPAFRSLGELLGAGAARARGGDQDEGRALYFEAVRPLAVAVNFEDGSRFGAKYGRAVGDIYERFKVLFSGALGSALAPENIGAAGWQDALGRPGVYFDFQCPQPLSILSDTLGGGAAPELSERSARRFLLAEEEGSLFLYYINEPDGGFYRAETALTSFSLEPLLQEHAPNGAIFEYENPLHNGLDPYFMFLSGMPSISAAEARAPQRDARAELLPVFGMNRYVAESVSIAGGEEYAEDSLRLEVYADGRLRFQDTSPVVRGWGGGALSAAAAVELAYGVAEACLQPVGGRDFLLLRALRYDQKELLYTVEFSYVLAGLPVGYPNESAAAEIKIKNGVLVGAELRCREYTLKESERELVLPDTQEAGVAAEFGGGEPRLQYKDRGNAVSAAWSLR